MRAGYALIAVGLLANLQVAVAAAPMKRGLVACWTDGGVYISWRLLAEDPPDAAFHVYRHAGGGTPVRATSEPLRGGTNWLDDSPAAAQAAGYSIAIADGERGEAAGVLPANDNNEANRATIRFQGDYAAQKVGIGDLDGDGRLDYVVKQPNFNVDPYEAPGYWKKSQDTYKLEAYNADGRFMWRHDMGWSIEEGIWYSPYVVYDLDGDGRAEVYTKAGEGDPRDPDGRVTSGAEWLVKLDGATGNVLQRLPWPDRNGYDRYNYYCRNLLGIAYLDGRSPHLIVQRGTYTLIKVEAYNGKLERVWAWDSKSEKDRYAGQGMHGMHAADVDADGRDEIIIGSAVLDDTGRGLWTRSTGHPDACYVGDIDPARPGLEIFFGIEPRQKRDAVCLAEARSGKTLWGCDESSTHVHHQGLAADLLAEYPGQECYAGEKDSSRFWLYTADGRRIGDRSIGGLAPRAAWWDGDAQKELILDGRIVDFQLPAQSQPADGGERQTRPAKSPAHDSIGGTVIGIADVLGDWREEIITSLPGELRIYTTGVPTTTRRAWLMQDRLYRTDTAAAAMGYFSPPQLSKW